MGYRLKLRWGIYSLLLCLLFISNVNGQKYHASEFKLHTSKDGLSHNFVTAIEQDGQGYIWISTDVGLNRFDGHSFSNYTNNTEPLMLASGIIRNLKLFGKEELGVISRSGFQIINTKDFSVKDYFIPDSTAFSSLRNTAWDAIALPDQSIALTTTSGFYLFNKNKQLTFRHDAYSINDVGKKRIFFGRYMLSLNDRDLLVFVEENAIAHFDTKTNQFYQFKEGDQSPFNFSPVATAKNRGVIHHYQLSNQEILFFHFAKNSIVYYNTSTQKIISTPLPISKVNFSWESKIYKLTDSTFAVNGATTGFYICHLDKRTGIVTMNPNSYLKDYKILCLKMDKAGKLWIGTSKGLLQQSNASQFLTTYDIKSSPADSVTGGLSAAFHYKNNLYLGRLSLNKGLVIVDPLTKTVKKQINFFQNNSSWNEVSSIQMYHPDTLYIGTSAGLLWLDTKSDNYGKVPMPSEVSQGLNILAPVRNDGYAWMCSQLNGIVARYHVPTRTFTVFTPKTIPALPFSKIKSIAYDSYGDVWIGGHSLARWNNSTNQFDTLITVYGGVKKFNEDILMLNADSNGSLWIHNVENGLLEYQIKEKKWYSYSIKEGLPSDALECFSKIIGNDIWLGGANNLTRFNIQTKETVVYDFSDGYTEEVPKGKAIEFDNIHNKLYLFTNQLVTEFPAQSSNEVHKANDILIQEIRVNNARSVFHPSNGVSLNHNENNLSLYFSIIDYENSNYRFFYKMKDDEEWIPLKGVRTLNLSGLNPGDYTIQFKAIGKWGEQKQRAFSFVIEKPWWQSIFFLVSILCLIVLIAIGAYRYRIKQIRAKANIDKKLAQTEMKALHAQMNPHFISNSLNSIREMILNDENKDASRYLTKFAHLIRITLEHSLMHFVSLRNTIDYLNRYAEMEMIRNSKFTFRQHVTDDLPLDEVLLPPMLIQPFIENSIWHGANNKFIDITVSFSQENDQLVCVIEDNGIGINQSLELKKRVPELQRSIGIENIRNRIQLLNEKYDMKSSISIEDKSDRHIDGITGTIVTIKLKLQNRDI